MKLMSMTRFVLEQLKINQSCSEFKEAVKNYADLLTQPLTIGMFVPCDEDNNVLEEPLNDDWYYEQWIEAKQRVLFEGFEISYWDYDGSSKSFSVRKKNGHMDFIQVCYYKSKPNYFIWSFNNIEQLSDKDLELTESAKQKLGL